MLAKYHEILQAFFASCRTGDHGFGGSFGRCIWVRPISTYPSLKTHIFPLKISHFCWPPKFGTEVIILPSFFMRIFKACQAAFPFFSRAFLSFPFRLPVSDRSIPPVWYPGWKVGIPSATRSVRNATGRSWTVAKSCTCHGMPGSPSEPSGRAEPGATPGSFRTECLGNGCGRGRVVGAESLSLSGGVGDLDGWQDI